MRIACVWCDRTIATKELAAMHGATCTASPVVAAIRRLALLEAADYIVATATDGEHTACFAGAERLRVLAGPAESV
jgi:hypothetical protein